jgi:hypothetical protein
MIVVNILLGGSHFLFVFTQLDFGYLSFSPELKAVTLYKFDIDASRWRFTRVFFYFVE